MHKAVAWVDEHNPLGVARKNIAADNFIVNATKSVFDEISYIVMGQNAKTGELFPVSTQYKKFDDAWKKRLEFEMQRR